MKIHWFFKVILILASLFFLWVIFYYILPKLLPAQKIKNNEVYGIILSDQIWEGEIRIVGDIFSPTNSTITVMPGTKIYVAIKGDKSNLDFLPWHQKSGVNTGEASKGVQRGEPFWDESEKIQIHLNNLVMQGDPLNPITMSSDSVDPSPYDFNIIKINSGNITNAVFSNYRRFEAGPYVSISNSTFRETGECALCFTRGSPKVINNAFENSLRESIWIQKASPIINNNLFINLEGKGIVIDSKRLSVPEITNNVFEMPQHTAIEFISGGQINEGLIARNIFSGNSLIKIACDTKVKIRDNVLLGLISFTNGCDGSYIFGPNFWGTPDPRVVMKEKILEKYDKFNISIPNVLLSAPKEAGRK